MDKKITVLEEIIGEVAADLYVIWQDKLPENQRDENSLKSLQKNASESTLFVIQSFMDKFNKAAEELKNN